MSDAALPRDGQAILLIYVSTNKLTTVGVVLSALLIVIALIAPFIVPHDPLDQSFLAAGQGPSAEYWFGTDAFGRDVFSRVLIGARVSLSIGIVAPVLAAIAGVWTGILAGYFGGWTDRLLSRFADLLIHRRVRPTAMLGHDARLEGSNRRREPERKARRSFFFADAVARRALGRCYRG